MNFNDPSPFGFHPALRNVPFGFERLAPAQHQPRHHHADAYATVVLAGAFEQMSYCGRHRVAAGDILIQPTLDAHANRMLSASVDIIRLPWGFDASRGGVYRGLDADRIRRLADRDVIEAARFLARAITSAATAAPLLERPADELAARLVSEPGLRLSHWTRERLLSREGLSRDFGRLFRTSPVRFRMEARARAAWLASLTTTEPLATLALAQGFADQAHMTRSIRGLTGSTPAAWRRWSQKYKTAATA